jgi:NADH-quinone oxidoreductase subunit L
MGISVSAAAIGFLGAWYLYYKRADLPAKMAASAGGLYRLVLDKYRIDELYGAAIIRPIVLISTNVLWKGVDAAIIDGAVNGSAAGAQDVSDEVRQMQSGNIRSYAGWVAAGAAAVIVFMVWKGVR